MGAHAVAAAETMTTAAKAVPHAMASATKAMTASHAVAAHTMTTTTHVTAATAAVAVRGLDVCDWSESEAHRSEPSAQKSNA